jgi:hypothetical protein
MAERTVGRPTAKLLRRRLLPSKAAATIPTSLSPTSTVMPLSLEALRSAPPEIVQIAAVAVAVPAEAAEEAVVEVAGQVAVAVAGTAVVTAGRVTRTLQGIARISERPRGESRPCFRGGSREALRPCYLLVIV